MKKSTTIFFVVLSCFLWNFVYAQSDTLMVVGGSGGIGSTGNVVPIRLTNSQHVRALQLTLNYKATYLLYLDVTPTLRTSHMSIFEWSVPYPGQLRLVITDLGINTIPPDTGNIAKVLFNVSMAASPGDYPLILTEVLASNPSVDSINIATVDGIFTVEDWVIPVELAAFSATVLQNQNSVEVKWSTSTETNNYGFEIQRGTSRESPENIAFVKGNGTTTTPHQYRFIDSNLPLGHYFYRLKQIDFDGSITYSEFVEVTISSPTSYYLAQNYPNPISVNSWNPQTSIQYQLPREEHVVVKIFNLLGQEVRTLVSEKKQAGYHTVNWDGRNQQGAPVVAGIYYYQMKTDSFVRCKKMLILN